MQRPATRERSVVVRTVTTEHRARFPSRRPGPFDGGRGCSHREVVSELRPVCDQCDASLAAQEAMLAEAAVGIFKGMAAMFAIVAVVTLGLFAAVGVLVWRLFQAH